MVVDEEGTSSDPSKIRTQEKNHEDAHKDSLPGILTAELGSAQQVVAQNVLIEIILPADVRPVRMIGREGRIQAQRVEVPLYQLHGSQSRFALLEVAVPPREAGALEESGLDNRGRKFFRTDSQRTIMQQQ
jgi:hypothetical protein